MSLHNLQLPHFSNLETKRGNPRAASIDWRAALTKIVPAYKRLSEAYSKPETNVTKWLELTLPEVETYLSLLRSPVCKIFAHQSDFISSVVPEFCCILLQRTLKLSSVKGEIITQSNIAIEYRFTAHCGGRLVPNFKRVDVAVGVRSSLTLGDEKPLSLFIPVVACEVKTNLDKNMIAGVENSAESLRKTFPNCRYLLITEFADFAIDKQNYASSKIDEILILRHQKRSSARSGSAIQNISASLLADLSAMTLQQLNLLSKPPSALAARLSSGRLIKR